MPIRRRTRRDPKPRFKADRIKQLDAVGGCIDLQVPDEHLARSVWRIVARFDLSTVEAQYSSLGRHGYSPRNVLAVWVYASLIGMHEGTKVSRLLQTDAAMRFLSGGHRISRAKLNEFRAEHVELFTDVIRQTVAMAHAEGFLPVDDLAADSMRLRAHASLKKVRSVNRSTARLNTLRAVAESEQTEAEREQIGRHEAVLKECAARGKQSLVATNPSAVMMKFPDGSVAPGHRMTTVSAGVKERFIVAVLVTPDASDYGMLEPAVETALAMLEQAGIPGGTKLALAADAGYASLNDLIYTDRVRERIDILVDAAHPTGVGRSKFFGHDRFQFAADGASATCPAGRAMTRRRQFSDGTTEWNGVGCGTCPLRPECTAAKQRTVTVHLERERLRAAMKARLLSPDGKQRYSRRMANIEPVFSNIESNMHFRRASSRRETTVIAEVMLKVLAHNVSRLLVARRLRCVYLVFN